MKTIGLFTSMLLLLLLISESVYAKQDVALLADKDNTASNVYVLGNRQITFDNNTPTILNRVKTSNCLDFMVAKSVTSDSLHIAQTDSADFLSEMAAIEGDWVVFVHGDAKTLEQSIWRGLAIQETYDINVLIFSWPSKDLSLRGVKNFKRSRSHVGESLNHFMQMLEFVEVFREVNPALANDQKISLLFHSLGNLYMETMVENDLQVGLSEDLFDNVILNAAAVNQESHGQWVEKMNIQDRIYITSNRHDFNLKGLRIFTSDGKQLGEKTTLGLANNANYIHFDETVGFKLKTGQTHTYFVGEVPAQNRNVKEFYSILFHGEAPNLDNESKFYLRKDNLGYEMISELKE